VQIPMAVTFGGIKSRLADCVYDWIAKQLMTVYSILCWMFLFSNQSNAWYNHGQKDTRFG